jgi:hypothetical protein
MFPNLHRIFGNIFLARDPLKVLTNHFNLIIKNLCVFLLRSKCKDLYFKLFNFKILN